MSFAFFRSTMLFCALLSSVSVQASYSFAEKPKPIKVEVGENTFRMENYLEMVRSDGDFRVTFWQGKTPNSLRMTMHFRNGEGAAAWEAIEPSEIKSNWNLRKDSVDFDGVTTDILFSMGQGAQRFRIVWEAIANRIGLEAENRDYVLSRLDPANFVSK